MEAVMLDGGGGLGEGSIYGEAGDTVYFRCQ